MMAYLLAAGTRDFEWKEKLLNQILSFKKQKIVKEFVSYWWKEEVRRIKMSKDCTCWFEVCKTLIHILLDYS